MYYTLGPTGDRPPPPYEGMRKYWSYRGATFATAYDQGVTDGKLDLTNENTAQLTIIETTPVGQRDDLWDAHLDGYRDATRKDRGATELSNGF